MAKAKVEKTNKEKLASAAGTYFRAAFAAVVALAMAGETSPEVLINAFIAGFAGPALKFVNPKFTEYGIKK